MSGHEGGDAQNRQCEDPHEWSLPLALFVSGRLLRASADAFAGGFTWSPDKADPDAALGVRELLHFAG